MHQAVTAAIVSRSTIAFWYDGHLRVVEPHRLGLSAKGEYILRAYQTGGTSSSGVAEGWRLFQLAKMSNLSVETTTFVGVRQGFTAFDRAMVTVLASL